MRPVALVVVCGGDHGQWPKQREAKGRESLKGQASIGPSGLSPAQLPSGNRTLARVETTGVV